MSKKISEMGLKPAIVDPDEVTILDSEDPSDITKNKRVPRSTFLAGMATTSSVDAVQSNLDTHTATDAGTAHPNGVNQDDLSNHKSGANQHPISGVTGLQTALDEKANTSDLGDSASRNVGIGAGDVAQGDAPAAAVTAHETTFAHANLPTPAQKAALDANPTLSGGNAVAGNSQLPSGDQQAAMDAADNPSGLNAFITASARLHATLPDLNTSGHPGSAIVIGGGTLGNAVSIAADGSLQDSGVPPGGTGSTNLSNTPSSTEVTIESSSGTNTSVEAATGSLAGVMSAADKTKLDGLSGGGIPEAPSDGNGYRRKDAAWEQDPIQSDAPSNGQDYVRKDGAWAIAPTSGWQDGTVVTDWGLTVQALGTVGGGTSAVDLDNGHVVTATLNNDQIINFTSTAGQTTTQWVASIVTAGHTPTFQFGGVAIDLPKDYDVSGSPQRIDFTFLRTPLGVSVSERQIP